MSRIYIFASYLFNAVSYSLQLIVVELVSIAVCIIVLNTVEPPIVDPKFWWKKSNQNHTSKCTHLNLTHVLITQAFINVRVTVTISYITVD